MKQILFYLVISLLISQSKAQSIRFVYNKDYATIQFVKRLLDPYPSLEKKLYFQLRGLDLPTLHFLDSLKLDNITYNLRYHDYPIGQKMNLNFSRLMEKYIIDQTPEKSFRSYAEGIIPEEYIVQYERLLYHFRPIYDELIDRPHGVKIDIGLQLLEKNNQLFKTEELLHKIAKFYGVKMKDYNIMIYPILDNLLITGTSFLNVAEVNVPINDMDSREILITAIHEICHLFYADMPNVTKRRLEYIVSNSVHKSARYSNWLLDEVLATSIGSGWASKELYNSNDNGVWYFRNTYVNDASKQVSQLVTDYLFKGKTLDVRFMELYLDRLRNLVAHFTKEWEFLLMYREVRVGDREYLDWVDRYYPIYYYRRYMMGNSVGDMQPNTTKLFVFTENYAEERLEIIKYLGDSVVNLFDFSEPFAKTYQTSDYSYFIFIYGNQSFVEESLKEKSKWYQYQLKRKKRRNR